MMKKYGWIVIFLIAANTAVVSQNKSLAYNAVVTLAGNSITTSPYTIATVPSGKVWKIEHIDGYRANISYGFPAFSFNINGVETGQTLFTTAYGTSGNLVLFNNRPSGPIWLKAGDVIKIYEGSSSYPVSFFLSVIEFNEVISP